jgi:DNA-binding IclR family transcriptional regulator
MARKKDPSDYMIQAVDAAFNLLEQYRGEVAELGTAELAQRLRLSRNATARLLANLETRGYLERNRVTNNYRLGLNTLELGQVAINQRNLLQVAPPFLKQMAQACNETAYLVVLKQGCVVYAGVAETTQPIGVVSRLGMWRPLHCTASGKVHLAFMAPEERAAFLPAERLETFTPHGCATRTALEAELAVIARQGYAIDNEELEPDVRCVASPLRNFTGRVIGALSLSGPSDRFSDRRLAEELAPLVQQTSADLSARLGYLET